jgi:hypothetical protein
MRLEDEDSDSCQAVEMSKKTLALISNSFRMVFDLCNVAVVYIVLFGHKDINFLAVKKQNSQVHCAHSLLSATSSHSLEALLVGNVNLRNLVVVFLKLVDELGGVKLAVGAASLDDVALLLKCEVLPCEVGADVLLEKSQDLVMGDGTGVGEVVDAKLFVLGHEDGRGEEIGEESVGVGDIDYTLVLCDLGNE